MLESECGKVWCPEWRSDHQYGDNRWTSVGIFTRESVCIGSKCDLAHLSGRRTKDKEDFLNIIPGPSRYEQAYLDDAGKFGAGQVQRENFAGRCQGGAPIYTGR